MLLGNNARKMRQTRFGLKWLVIACTLLIPVLSASASEALPPSPRTQERQASFYVNVGLGIDIFNSPVDSRQRNFPTAVVHMEFDHVGRIINSSPAVSLGAGYMGPLNRWFNLGVRVFLRYANNFDSFDGGLDSTVGGTIFASNRLEIELRNFEYGLDFTPSVNVGVNQFITGIFGAAFNRVQLSSDPSMRLIASPVSPSPNSMRRHIVGLRLGYSVEELLSPYFGVYMTYIWTDYGTFHLLQTINATNHNYDGNNGVTLQTHNILLGLKYYFSQQHYRSRVRTIANTLNHFYVSMAFGPLITQTQASGDWRFVIPGITTFGHQDGDNGGTTPMGVLGIGYALLVHHAYFGVEALMNVGSSTGKSDLNTIGGTNIAIDEIDQNIHTRLNTFEGAFDLKLGGLIAPQMLLISRVGIAVNNIRMENLAEGNPSGVSSLTINQSVSKSVAGLRFGLGVENVFSDNMSLTMNYVYTYYGHISAEQATSTATRSMRSAVSARVGTHAVTVGVNYYFS